MKHSMFCVLLLFAIFMILNIPTLSNAQSHDTDSLEQLFNRLSEPLTKADISLKLSRMYQNIDLTKSKNYAHWTVTHIEIDSLQKDGWDQLGRIYIAQNNPDSALIAFERAKSHARSMGDEIVMAQINNRIGIVFLRQNKYQQALETFLNSVSIFEKNEEEVSLAICYNNIAGVFAEMGNYEKAVNYNEKALEIFRRHDMKKYEIITLAGVAGQYLRIGDTVRSLEYNLVAEKLAYELEDHYALGITYNNIGQIYTAKNNPGRAIEFYKKSLEQKEKVAVLTNLVPTYNNLGESYIDLNRPKAAIESLVRALALAKGQVRQTIYSNLTRACILAGKQDSALLFLEKTIISWDSMYADRERKAVTDLMIRYETEAKENEILTLESEKRRTQMLLYVTAGLLIIGLLVAILVIKNHKKKKIIAQQKTKLEQQRVRQLLQELETRGIYDLVGIQEAERKKIAEELHDHVGGSLSTLKLYFDTLSPTLKRAEFADLHSNAGFLLDETYENIRNIARKYNSGVSINKGLLPAVRSMAQSISATGKIAIQVMETGLSDRLENSVEIALFKSIKELASNAVKHADPTQVVIEFVRHEDVLTILVQDNGSGFDPGLESNGMGLMSIRHRIDQLGGEMTVDSSFGYGTTVIINIPLI